jgi:glycerol-3-phosphate dehydrogenase subunit B
MKFDTIIIGGGLAGLTAGIELSRKGQKCLIVSSGQSALHFFSGSLELCSLSDNPYDAIASLSAEHPYSNIGVERVKELSAGVKSFFKEVGATFKGQKDANHWRITPLGVMKRAWLTLDEYATFPSTGELPWKKVALLNIDGFLDFHTSYIAAGLAEKGVETVVKAVTMPELERLRNNPTEMRSTNIAKTLTGDLLGSFAARINEHAKDVDAVLMPAVVGLAGCTEVVKLKEMVARPVHFLAPLPPSVPGIRLQMMLKKHFQKLGGTYMLGDSVVSGEFENGSLKSIRTANHGDVTFEADNFILASGSFFSKGLASTIDGVTEPVFGLDVDSIEERAQWYKRDMFEAQPYMSFGVATDNSFKAKKDGQTVDNLYAIGSILSGFNAMKDGCGAGVAMLTAMQVSSNILQTPENE